MSKAEELLSDNPFPGLRPFSASEADRFFGRQQQISELVQLVDRTRFVAVSGVSGCGKSSLVCAGLLSELTRRSEAGGAVQWRPAVLRPGSSPIANLAEKLSPVIGQGGVSEECRTGAIYGRLRLGSLGLVEAVRTARLDPQVRVLLVVDQFEEIFRFKRMIDADEASAFVKLLLTAAADPESAVSVVLTLRSETLGDCADFLELPEAINKGQYLVPKLTREQRKETIIKPVEMRGHSIAPRLVQRLLSDVSSSYDDLPVMQHVLARTWRRWAESCEGARAIDLEDYEAVGTAKGAISNHADEAYLSLAGLEPVTARVFGALTERVSDCIEIRRPVPFDRLCQIVGAAPAEVEQVVERFRRPDTAFLMPPQEVPLASNPVIDISHESLIRQWQRLRDWSKKEAESRAMMARLLDAAQLYEKGEGGLWQDPGLKSGLEWQRATKPTAEWVELGMPVGGAASLDSVQRFLDLSSNAARRAQWQRKASMWGMAFTMLTVLAIGVGLRMLHQSKAAELSGQALLNLDLDPAKSAHLAAAALDMSGGNLQAESALRQSMAALETASLEFEIPIKESVQDLRFTSDGGSIVVASGKKVSIVDPNDPLKPIRTVVTLSKDTIKKAWVTGSGIAVTLSVDEDGISRVCVTKIGSLHKDIVCDKHGDGAAAVAMTSNERYFAVARGRGRIAVLDLAAPFPTPAELQADASVTALAFSQDGQYLASGDSAGAVKLWKLGRGSWGKVGADAAGTTLSTDPIQALAFHPYDRRRMLAASGNKVVLVKLDLRSGRATADKPEFSHNYPVSGAKFVVTKDGVRVLTIANKTARLWLNDTRDWRQIRRHDDWITDADVHCKADLMVTGSVDGTARLWSARCGGLIATFMGHQDTVTHAIFNRQGDRVVTSSEDGTVRLWRFSAPQLLSAGTKAAVGAVFNPAGDRVAIAAEDECKIIPAGEACFCHKAVSLGSPAFNPQKNLFYYYVHPSWRWDGKRLLASRHSLPVGESQTVLWKLENPGGETEIADKTPDWLKKCKMAQFSAGSNEVVTVDGMGVVSVWDAASIDGERPVLKDERKTTQGHLAAISSDGRWIAADAGYKVLLWDRKNPSKAVIELAGHKGFITDLRFTRDGDRLLSASTDLTARIWSTGDGALVTEIKGGHTGYIASAAFDPDGRLVATASADRTIRIWDAGTGVERVTLRRHSETVNSVAFSPIDKRILSASDDGTVKLGECRVCFMELDKLKERLADFAGVQQKTDENGTRKEGVLSLVGKNLKALLTTMTR